MSPHVRWRKWEALRLPHHLTPANTSIKSIVFGNTDVFIQQIPKSRHTSTYCVQQFCSYIRVFCWAGLWGVDRCVIVVDEPHSCITTVSRKGFVKFVGEVLMSVLLCKTILVYITIICRWSADEGWWLGDSLSPIEIYTPTLSHRPNTDWRN